MIETVITDEMVLSVIDTRLGGGISKRDICLELTGTATSFLIHAILHNLESTGHTLRTMEKGEEVYKRI